MLRAQSEYLASLPAGTAPDPAAMATVGSSGNPPRGRAAALLGLRRHDEGPASCGVQRLAPVETAGPPAEPGMAEVGGGLAAAYCVE